MPILVKIKLERGCSFCATNAEQFQLGLESAGMQVNSSGNRNLVREIWDALVAGEIEVQSKEVV